MYAATLVANPIVFMNSFMMGVSELVEEECSFSMIVDDMDISN